MNNMYGRDNDVGWVKKKMANCNAVWEGEDAVGETRRHKHMFRCLYVTASRGGCGCGYGCR